jgi:hypothetical protein
MPNCTLPHYPHYPQYHNNNNNYCKDKNCNNKDLFMDNKCVIIQKKNNKTKNKKQVKA